MAVTETFSGILFVIFTHCELGSEILVFLYKPPVTPPVKTVSSVLSLGSNIMAFVLPPTLLGPLSYHLSTADSPGTIDALALLSLFFLSSS